MRIIEINVHDSPWAKVLVNEDAIGLTLAAIKSTVHESMQEHVYVIVTPVDNIEDVLPTISKLRADE